MHDKSLLGKRSIQKVCPKIEICIIIMVCLLGTNCILIGLINVYTAVFIGIVERTTPGRDVASY